MREVLTQVLPKQVGLVLSSAGASLVAQRVKNMSAMGETCVQTLGQEDPLEKGKAAHSRCCPGNPVDRGAGGPRPWGHKELPSGQLKRWSGGGRTRDVSLSEPRVKFPPGETGLALSHGPSLPPPQAQPSSSHAVSCVYNILSRAFLLKCQESGQVLGR